MKSRVKVSVALHGGSKPCPGDCAFCGWGRRMTRPSERKSNLSDRLAVAESSDGMLDLMDDSTVSRTPSWLDFVEAARIINERELSFGVSPGICLSPRKMAAFRELGAVVYSSNLETSPERWPEIIGTHDQEDKVESLALARGVGLEIHTGFILGLPGTTPKDYKKMLALLDQVNPDALNLNFFHPEEGLPLSRDFQKPPEPEVFRLIKEFRQRFPSSKPIYLGAGRKLWLGDLEEEAIRLAGGCYAEGFMNYKEGE